MISSASILGPLLVFGAAALFLLLPPWRLNHDCAWYLDVAGVLLDGGTLYVDRIDVNPPLIQFLTLPSAWLVDRGWPPGLAWSAFVVMWCAAATVLVARATKSQVAPTVAGWVGVVVLAVPGYDFGQREHLALAALLPLALWTASDRSSPRWLAVSIGVFAGLGTALKPFFALGPALLLLAIAFRRRSVRALFAAEWLAMAGVFVAYGLHFLLWSPAAWTGFRETVDLALATYGGFESPLGQILGRHATIVALAALSLAALSLVILARGTRSLRQSWGNVDGETRRAWTGFLILGLGFLGAAILQRKGFSYHFYPVKAVGLLLLALLATQWIETTWSHRTWVGRVLVPALMVLVVIERNIEVDEGGQVRRNQPNLNLLETARTLRPWVGPGPYAAIDTDLSPHFPLVNYLGKGWALRNACLWQLPGLYPQEKSGDPTRYRAPEVRPAVERRVADMLFEDLTATKPPLLVVASPPHLFMADPEFDLEQWMRADPRFVTVFENYELAATAGKLKLYRRR